MSKEGRSQGSRERWDSIHVHGHMLWLTASKSRFRLRRLRDRILSPRRILATLSASIFLVLYLLYGVFVLANRESARPEHLRAWLSGGMVLYAFYHWIRCVWATCIDDLEMTPAEKLWLGGAPLQRSTIASYRTSNVIVATMMKTVLLTVVIARDVQRIELLVVGVFSSLLLLDTVRQIFERFSAGLDDAWRKRAQWGCVLIACSLALQVMARIWEQTPSDSPTILYGVHFLHAIGEVAQSGLVQWLAFAWIPSSAITVASDYDSLVFAQLIAIGISLLMAIRILVHADLWTLRQKYAQEQIMLAKYQPRNQNASNFPSRFPFKWNFVSQNAMLRPIADAFPLMGRQLSSIIQYRGTILFSFVVPTLLCLSPLLIDRVREQWLYVIGGVAMCTMLLAPPALRIDFRRDLKRMQLLKSLPVKPFSMVFSQLAFPIVITWSFQFITLTIGALIVSPGTGQYLMWTAVLFAFAIFTFAVENALFLVFPHHVHHQGFAMMLRAKLTFLGKASVITASLFALVLWAHGCKNFLPESAQVFGFISGAIVATWTVALLSLVVTTQCWRRFDLAFDLPPS